MNIITQLLNFIEDKSVVAAQFRGVLEGNNISYRSGWDGDAFIFSIDETPDVEFVFSDIDYGMCIAVVEWKD